jgi:predicted nucleotidyltransferase
MRAVAGGTASLPRSRVVGFSRPVGLPLNATSPEQMRNDLGRASLSGLLDPEELSAVRRVVGRVRRAVAADLVQASLFGSKARGESRHDSDVDILLVFEWLPDDREPYASDAEAIAEEVAFSTGVPVTVWSVSLIDLRMGNRTPMLVDALADSVPIWYRWAPLPSVDFTPADAVRCSEALLTRLAEGSREYSMALEAADWYSAARRARDDIVRACTALLLLRGITRPRRADAVHVARFHEFARNAPLPHVDRALRWAADSYGANGREENQAVPIPPCDPDELAAVVDDLHARIRAIGRQVVARTAPPPVERRG